MNYSIKPTLHHTADKNGQHKIQVIILYRRTKFTLATPFKVLPDQFENGRCQGFVNSNLINRKLMELLNKYESILINAMASNPDKETLKILFKDRPATAPDVPEISDITFAEYTKELIQRFKGKLGNARLIHYNTLAAQVKDFNNIKLKDITPKAATLIEQYLRSLGLAQNTLNTKMKLFIAVINQAKIEKLVAKDCMDGYKKPRYNQTIPDYLTEKEMEQLKIVTDASVASRYKVAGNYFLLSCHTGYRISDLRQFNYDASVKDGKIVILAKKNNEIVMIPVYPALAEILEQVKKYPFYFTEQSMRKYVKELAMIAGLNRKIKVHTARHTFAMMLMNKGFTIDEVAQLLGDSKDVAKIYARVSNTQLENKIKEKLG